MNALIPQGLSTTIKPSGQGPEMVVNRLGSYLSLSVEQARS
jgi:hypothetical protein